MYPNKINEDNLDRKHSVDTINYFSNLITMNYYNVLVYEKVPSCYSKVHVASEYVVSGQLRTLRIAGHFSIQNPYMTAHLSPSLAATPPLLRPANLLEDPNASFSI